MQCIFVQQTGITKSSKAWLFHHKFIDKNDEKIVKNGRNVFSGQMILDNHEILVYLNKLRSFSFWLRLVLSFNYGFN